MSEELGTADEQLAGDDVGAGAPGTEGTEYVAGDVNTKAAPADHVDDMIGNRAEGGLPTEVLVYVARALVSEPDAVVVQADQDRDTTRLRLHVAPEDMGRVIGRRGRTAQAIRTLVGAAGARDGVHTFVDIVDD